MTAAFLAFLILIGAVPPSTTLDDLEGVTVPDVPSWGASWGDRD